MAHYKCLNCPGYCCSYPIIALTKRDIELAHFIETITAHTRNAANTQNSSY